MTTAFLSAGDISRLTAADSISADTLVPVVQNGVLQTATASQIGNQTLGNIVLYASKGTFALNGVNPVEIVDSAIVEGSFISFSLITANGTPGLYPNSQTVTPGEGFSVTGLAGDTSLYKYINIIAP